MGQGYSVIHPSAGSAGIDAPEVIDLEYERPLNGARFLKTVRARHKNGVVVVKVYTKPFSTLKLDTRVAQLIDERHKLADVPNALPYHRILDTTSSAFLVRQYVHSSLYDRISTNPPLEEIERKWISFQLLCAVRDCHARGIYHGDIKTDNMLVTSWNWLYLTDFAASIKPHFLPEDNPVDFTLFYDTTPRRICYIAPERFISGTSDETTALSNGLQWSMDIFSVGCVIAELFTEKPTFTLSQLFRYKKNDYDPRQLLLPAIKDNHVREMVSHMIGLDPNDRYSAQEYLDFWRIKAFPAYFYDFLHQYTQLLTDSSADIHADTVPNPVICDDRIERIYNDYDKISYALGLSSCKNDKQKPLSSNSLNLHLLPLCVDVPGNRHTISDGSGVEADNGALLFSSIVISSLRSASKSAARLKACELLLTFAEHLTDEAKLDRILPYAVALLEDEATIVRVAALRSITQLLSLIRVLSPMNAFIFPRYILPRLSKFVSSAAFRDSPVDRATYAACLANLALTASRFLDMTQALRADGSLPSIDPEAEDDAAAYAALQISYDITRDELVQQFEVQTKLFLTDSDTSVRRAFLSSVGPLSVFFGQSLASDLILTHLNTFINDEDWMLRCALAEVMVAVAAFFGHTTLESFILPLIIQGLPDAEETVTEQLLRALAGMVRLGLLSKWTTLQVVTTTLRFTMHPNHWVREATSQLIANVATCCGIADFRSLIEPLLRTVLKTDVVEASQVELLDSLKKPMTRPVLDLAKAWVGRAEKGSFWNKAKTTKSFSFDASSMAASLETWRDSEQSVHSARNEEDEQWMTRLHNAGMRAEDEAKLIALRDFIWRVAHKAIKMPQSRSADLGPEKMMSLTTLKTPLQNVLFDDDLKYYEQISQRQDLSNDAGQVDGNSHEGTTSALRQTDKAQGIVAHMSRGAMALPTMTSAPQDKQEATASSRSRLGNHLHRPESLLSSSPASYRSQDSKSHGNHRLREQAIGLMRKADVSKADAETSTNATIAAGHVNIPASGWSTPTSMVAPSANIHTRKLEDFHNSSIQAPLERHYLSNFPIDVADFGPRVQPIRVEQINYSGTSTDLRWKPRGVLVALLDEHVSQVTCIAVAPDHTFFLTGSTDGTVRVWDTARLESNVAHRARQVYQHVSAAGITSLTFVDGTHSFICAAKDGSLAVVKVEVDMSDSGKDHRYSKLSVMRSWSLDSAFPAADTAEFDEKDYIVHVVQSRLDAVSHCSVLTWRGRFVTLDLKDMQVQYSFENPKAHGSTTAFCMHRRRQWVLIGTEHGVLDLWDVRFRLKLRSWTFRHPAPITKLDLYPGQRTSHRMKIVMSGGTGPNHVSIWDIEKLVCSELYRASSGDTRSKIGVRDIEVVHLDDDRQSKQLETTSGASRDTGATASTAQSPKRNETRGGEDSKVASGRLRDFVMRMHIPADGIAVPSEARHHFLLTAGPDWKTEYWDSEKPAESMVVNNGAMEMHSQGSSDIGMRVTAAFIGANTKVYTDSIPVAQATESAEDTASPMKVRGRADRSASSVSVSTVRAAAKQSKPSRYDVMRNSARHLLRGHRDEITCVALIEKPFGMIITGDRSGAVYVFQ